MRAGARVELRLISAIPWISCFGSRALAPNPAWDIPGAMAVLAGISNARPCRKSISAVFDIHGGGTDLLFPHHENEVAQSTCAHGTEIMANVWMHNGHLQVEGQKMSKSLGNFITIHDLLTNWHGLGWPGEALRFNMLRTHYRQPLDWTYEGLDEAHKTLWDWYGTLETVAPAPEAPIEVLNALGDDLNTPEMIAAFHKLFREKRFSELLVGDQLIGDSRDKTEPYSQGSPLEARTVIRSIGGSKSSARNVAQPKYKG